MKFQINLIIKCCLKIESVMYTNTGHNINILMILICIIIFESLTTQSNKIILTDRLKQPYLGDKYLSVKYTH